MTIKFNLNFLQNFVFTLIVSDLASEGGQLVDCMLGQVNVFECFFPFVLSID